MEEGGTEKGEMEEMETDKVGCKNLKTLEKRLLMRLNRLLKRLEEDWKK